MKDVPLYLKWFNDQKTTEFLAYQGPMTEEAEKEFLNKLLTQPLTDGVNLAICLKPDLRTIGSIGLFDRKVRDQRAELGIVIGDKKHWAKVTGARRFSSCSAMLLTRSTFARFA